MTLITCDVSRESSISSVLRVPSRSNKLSTAEIKPNPGRSDESCKRESVCCLRRLDVAALRIERFRHHEHPCHTV